MSRIKLSHKHGVNPSVEVCYYCGESKGVVLFGQLKGDEEAPRKCVIDREPCEKCAGYMRQGVILISVKDGDYGKDDPYRTGGFAVVTGEAIERAVRPRELAEQILKKRVAFIEDQSWALLGLPTE